MTDREQLELLNAYIDGELSPREDARVAREIARNPDLAARVATLTRLKSKLADLAEAPPRPVTIPRSRWRTGFVAAAASIGLLVGIGVSVMGGYWPFQTEDFGWFEEAAAVHEQWSRFPAEPDAKKIDANLLLANLDRVEIETPPDLTSARLRLTYLRLYEATARQPAALHLGYTGRRGCRVTLWATTAPQGLTAALMETREGKLRGFRWRVRNTAYALFATGMAEDRFTTIAEKVYKATREHRGFDEETRMALNQASTTAPPCAA